MATPPDMHARAADAPLTNEEIDTATQILSGRPACVATLQRRMRIGWNRAADLLEHIKGTEALPEAARNR